MHTNIQHQLKVYRLNYDNDHVILLNILKKKSLKKFLLNIKMLFLLRLPSCVFLSLHLYTQKLICFCLSQFCRIYFGDLCSKFEICDIFFLNPCLRGKTPSKLVSRFTTFFHICVLCIQCQQI